MAPPPSPTLPLQQRLIALAQTLQFAWFVGHTSLIACTIRYAFSFIRFNYNSRMGQFCYRTSFIAAAVTYGIVVYKGWRARAKSGNKAPGGALSFLGDENAQYLALALVWLFSPQYPLALLPYAVYSLFHVLVYSRQNLIPTIQPPTVVAPASTPNGKPTYAPNAISEKIGAFVKEYYEASMAVVSGLEILIWLRLLLAAVLFQRRSWILLGIYTVFIRSRFSQSTHVQNSFSQLEARIDNLVSSQGTPPAARQVWDGIKNGARQFHSATDVNKYTNGATAPKKAE